MWAKRLLWVVTTLQLLFLGGLLLDYEMTKNEGTLFRLELQAYDPYDMFRGNYLALNYKEDRVRMAKFEPRSDEKFYIKLSIDPKSGFARPAGVSRIYPVDGADWVQVKNAGGRILDENDTMLMFSFMQDRFFMNENKVKEAEKILRKATEDTTKRCWAEMRVRNGTAILTDVKIDGKSLKD